MERQRPLIAVCGAGGAPSEGVIFSLLASGKYGVLGLGADPYDLSASLASERTLIPYAADPDYGSAVLRSLNQLKPTVLHAQNDREILAISEIRADILELGTKLFLPPHDEVVVCTNKWLTYCSFLQAGLPVPENRLIETESDLAEAFVSLGRADGRIWIRDATVGGGGKGSLSTASLGFASNWVDHHDGWGHFVAAEHLTSETFTWQSLWHEGELVAAQGRARHGWIHGNRSISGVTGVTKVGTTTSRSDLVDLGSAAVKAVSGSPHGLYGVDFTLDNNNVPNPTEINIGRFFTTIRFFTEAGLNLPEIYIDLAIEGASQMVPPRRPLINPLPEGLVWLRGMDREPRLSSAEEIMMVSREWD